MGYGSWGHRESDVTWPACTHEAQRPCFKYCAQPQCCVAFLTLTAVPMVSSIAVLLCCCSMVLCSVSRPSYLLVFTTTLGDQQQWALSPACYRLGSLQLTDPNRVTAPLNTRIFPSTLHEWSKTDCTL